jgi:hypothetical protein
MRCAIAALFLVMTSSVACGSGIEDGDCFDCGPCGFVGGPNIGDSISFSSPGLDAVGRLVVPLRLDRDGECGGENASFTLVVFDNDVLAAESSNSYVELDTSSVMSADGDYWLSDPPTQITVARIDSSSVDITVSAGAVNAVLSCALSETDGGAITCS